MSIIIQEKESAEVISTSDNRTSIQEDVLEMIETALMNGNKNIEIFSQTLLESILKKYSMSLIKQTIGKLCIDKRITFIRHAEADHNSKENKQANKHKTFCDSQLTERGYKQTETIATKLLEKSITFDLICISPLRRTIQTFDGIVSKSKNSNTKYIITDLIREPITPFPKNIGMSLTKIKSYINSCSEKIDLSYLTKENWWTDDDIPIDPNNHPAEPKSLLYTNILLFLFWMLFRKENNIIMISHSKVCKTIFGDGMINGDLRTITSEQLQTHCLNFLNEYSNNNLDSKTNNICNNDNHISLSQETMNKENDLI